MNKWEKIARRIPPFDPEVVGKAVKVPVVEPGCFARGNLIVMDPPHTRWGRFKLWLRRLFRMAIPNGYIVMSVRKDCLHLLSHKEAKREGVA